MNYTLPQLLKALIDQGASVLTSLLGGKTVSALTDAVGEYAGVTGSGSKSLLGLLGPVVLGVRQPEEFRARLGETPHTWVEWAASQLLQNTPLHPLAEWGRLRYGGADGKPVYRVGGDLDAIPPASS